jgi:hypothetical protein
MAATVKIEKVNYTGKKEGRDYNAKVLYYKYGKLQLTYVYIDFFWNRVSIAKHQDTSCKVLKVYWQTEI